MGRKVLLFYMSLYEPTLNPEKTAYTRPQTNESAIGRFAGNESTKPDVIVALCSASVCHKAFANASPAMPARTTLEYMQKIALPRLGVETSCLRAIEVPDTLNEATQAEAIEKIVEEIDKDDTLYIDFTGGPRDIAMLLVSVARYLRDLKEVKIEELVYTDFQRKQTVSSYQLYRFYDLISAVDEFFATGSARRLQSYTDGNAVQDPKRQELLQAITTFSEDLSLCLVDNFTKDIKSVIQKASADFGAHNDLNGLLFQLLKQRVQEEFEKLQPYELPQLIEWCANRNLYQQALTLLTEQMPHYVYDRLNIRVSASGVKWMLGEESNKHYISETKEFSIWTPLFHYHFCQLVYPRLKSPKYIYKDGERKIVYYKTTSPLRLGGPSYRYASLIEIKSTLAKMIQEGFLENMSATQINLLTGPILCYQKVLQCRNQINHASPTFQQFDESKVLPLTSENLKALLLQTAEHLKRLPKKTVQ